MLDKRVEVIEPTSFYESMTGRVVQEEPKAVLVKIPLTDDYKHNVWFFKEQVEEIDENKYL